MENTLAKYAGKNLKDIITNLEVVQGTAKESGNIYYYIKLSFVNGFQKNIYLNSSEQFAWTNAFDTLDVTKQFDL